MHSKRKVTSRKRVGGGSRHDKKLVLVESEKRKRKSDYSGRVEQPNTLCLNFDLDQKLGQKFVFQV